MAYPSPPFRNPNTQLLLLLLLALSVICSGSPTSKLKRQASPSPSPGTGPASACGFTGNPDVYGLGIRLGIYTQWLSTYLSNWLHSANVTKMRSVNTCFQLAMFTALMAMANLNLKPHVIDPYIIIIQIIGSASTISKDATDKSQWSKTSWGGIIRFFLYWAVSLYAVWYWFVGLDTMELDAAGCAPVGFAFSRVDLHGWFRTVNKVAAIFFAVVYTVLFGYSVYNFGPEYYQNGKAKITTVYRRLPKHHQPEEEPDNALEQGLKEVVNGSMKLPRWTPAVCLLVLILAVIAGELVIVWNGVTGVNDVLSTGQLIPLVVGMGGLVQVLYKLKNQDDRAAYLVRRTPGGYTKK